MKNTQQLLDMSARPKLRLCEIERLIRLYRIIAPAPSRRFLIHLCEDGTFETAPRVSNQQPWLVYEDSFLKWVSRLDEKNIE